MTENKRFQYNVNKNTIEENGKFVAYMNCVDGVRVASKLNVLQKENEQLKQQLWNTTIDYYTETYSDNSIRRDEHIKDFKEEFKAKYGDVE